MVILITVDGRSSTRCSTSGRRHDLLPPTPDGCHVWEVWVKDGSIYRYTAVRLESLNFTLKLAVCDLLHLGEGRDGGNGEIAEVRLREQRQRRQIMLRMILLPLATMNNGEIVHL